MQHHCFIGEYQIHECGNGAGEILSHFQKRDAVMWHKQKYISLDGGEGKCITNPWTKIADKFKLKKISSNHLKSFRSLEGTAWPYFRQNDPLKILGDREHQSSHFRKIFKQGPVPVTDSVSRRFCVWVFFFLSEC